MEKEFIYPVKICKIEGKIENSGALLSKSNYLQIGLDETEYTSCIVVHQLFWISEKNIAAVCVSSPIRQRENAGCAFVSENRSVSRAPN